MTPHLSGMDAQSPTRGPATGLSSSPLTNRDPNSQAHTKTTPTQGRYTLLQELAAAHCAVPGGLGARSKPSPGQPTGGDAPAAAQSGDNWQTLPNPPLPADGLPPAPRSPAPGAWHGGGCPSWPQPPAPARGAPLHRAFTAAWSSVQRPPLPLGEACTRAPPRASGPTARGIAGSRAPPHPQALPASPPVATSVPLGGAA
eukprot:CAMPEP_0206247342 /NCGR_PEP_ID=MMETSP0047_2-20121206/19758_1 /ASSEMBLY_ACC=CAM_ASM_000192 /TAXON_ID=195065 /ORGANISM="Chroomonas mesostigmatica_cf, Strain CCMP1168" /LENGTH=199 /DNA_ID=CAMNT_0053672859 /DNA_START=214 /DNA_END=809 /DNA_ORIENTATION=+